MNDKEKQIEEMAKDYYGYSIDLEEDCKFVAEEMYDKGHRKLNEYSVVLSGEQCVEIVQDNYNIGYERGCKETAQKFYEFAKAWFEYYEQNDYFEEVKNLAEQCGVEIKD